jgi:hypothetical protein
MMEAQTTSEMLKIIPYLPGRLCQMTLLTVLIIKDAEVL